MTSSAKPLVIPIFIPHAGCPHRCAFCNQSVITSETISRPGTDNITSITDRYLSFKGKRKRVELAFFGGNFLGLDDCYIETVMHLAGKFQAENKIDGIRFSTRPDTITEARLGMLQKFPVSTVEIGVQSMDDHVLLMSQRGHRAKESQESVALLKAYGLNAGVQMMVGLPGEDEKSALQSAEKIKELHPDFVRIYPLVVIKGSLIEKWYRNGDFIPLSLEACIKRVKQIYTLFASNGIPVIRMGLQSSHQLQESHNHTVVAGPWHPAFGHLVLSEVIFDKVACLIRNKLKLHKNHKTQMDNNVTIRLHPAMESRLRGHKNCNIKRLAQEFPGIHFYIEKTSAMTKERIEVA